MSKLAQGVFAFLIVVALCYSVPDLGAKAVSDPTYGTYAVDSIWNRRPIVIDYQQKQAQPEPENPHSIGLELMPDGPYIHNGTRYYSYNGFDLKQAGYGLAVLVNVKFTNPNDFPVKDIAIKCNMRGPSGTIVSTIEAFAFHVVPANGALTVPRILLGFIPHNIVDEFYATCRAVKSYR